MTVFRKFCTACEDDDWQGQDATDSYCLGYERDAEATFQAGENACDCGHTAGSHFTYTREGNVVQDDSR